MTNDIGIYNWIEIFSYGSTANLNATPSKEKINFCKESS